MEAMEAAFIGSIKICDELKSEAKQGKIINQGNLQSRLDFHRNTALASLSVFHSLSPSMQDFYNKEFATNFKDLDTSQGMISPIIAYTDNELEPIKQKYQKRGIVIGATIAAAIGSIVAAFLSFF